MNPPLLMRDEVGVARSLGMKMDMRPEAITIFADTGRVSVRWDAGTKGYASGIRWALMAPPNHARKRNAVVDWLATSFVKPKK